VIIETNRSIGNDLKTRGCCSWYTFRTGIARNLRSGTVHLVVNHFFFCVRPTCKPFSVDACVTCRCFGMH